MSVPAFTSSIKNKLSLSLALWLGLTTLVGLSGCGSSSNDPDPIVSVNATGYYEGTASIKEEDNSTPLEIKDLKVLANGDQVLIMSASKGLLYVLKSINIADSGDYTATVNIFKEGSFLTTTTVSGSVTEGVSFTGIFSGLGAGNGSFSVDYSSVNDSDANLATIATDWFGYFNGTISTPNLFIITSSGELTPNGESRTGVLDRCEVRASFTPVLNENLYTITNIEISFCSNSNVNGADFSGLATTLSPANDTMAIIFYNDSFCGVSEMNLD